MQSRFFTYGGKLPIHYAVRGHGPVQAIFLHGFAASHKSWLDVAPLFPEDRYTLYLPDMKGFGLSGKPRDGAYAIADQVAIIRSLIIELGLSSVVLVGHSLGGAVALGLCLEATETALPFEVEKLVVLDCAAYPQKLPKFFKRLRSRTGALLLRLIPVRITVQDVLRKVFSDPAAAAPELTERYIRYFRGRGIVYALRATAKSIDPAAFADIGLKYRKLSLPVLIIWGREDRIIKIHNAYRLQQALPRARLEIIEQCGHNPHEECPSRTFDLIGDFLSHPDPDKERR
jgi:pimeloyl-ACP methyl ester carboxylesterase